MDKSLRLGDNNHFSSNKIYLVKINQIKWAILIKVLK